MKRPTANARLAFAALLFLGGLAACGEAGEELGGSLSERFEGEANDAVSETLEERTGVEFDYDEETGDVRIAIDDQVIESSQTEDGTVVVESTDENGSGEVYETIIGDSLPDGWPAEFEIYEGATDLVTTSSAQPDGTFWSANFSVDAPIDDVVEFYDGLFSDWVALGVLDTSDSGDRFVSHQFELNGNVGAIQATEQPDRAPTISVVFMTFDE